MDRLHKIKKQFLHPFSLLLCGTLCCFMVLYIYFNQAKTLSSLEEKAQFLSAKKYAVEDLQKLEGQVLSQIKKANRVYIEEVLAKLQFLKGETAKLQILTHENPQNLQMKERLDFLQNGKNTLHLKEQNFQRVGNMQEVEVVQTHPIELGRDDLIYLLCQLENVPLETTVPENNPPYFLIRQFDLLKKTLSQDEETFVLNLQMTKQEIVHE